MLTKKNSILAFEIVLIAQIFLWAGCPREGDMVNTDADFTGFITQINAQPNNDGNTILAESHAEKLVHRCTIEVTSNTTLLRWDGKNYQPVSFGDILLKDKIQAWFSPPTKESYPKHGKAKKVVVSSLINFSGGH